MDEGKRESEAGPGKLVKLEGRRRRTRLTRDTPPTTPATVPATADTSVLTPAQYAALFGSAQVDGMVPATVMAGAAGVGMMALRHLARRMVGNDSVELTAKDRIALAIAPKIVAEVKRNVSRRAEPGGAPLGGDPIAELLQGKPEPAGAALVTDTEKVKLET